jgi:serine protease Do
VDSIEVDAIEKEMVQMSNVSLRQRLARAGSGAAVLALVALAGYGIGESQAPRAIVSAAPTTAAAPRVDATIPGASYAGVVNAVSPAVVTVRVEARSKAVPTDMQQLPDDPLFREFFGRRFQIPQQRGPRPRSYGVGSGVITTPDGYILTNNHVVDGADKVRVELTDKRTFDAKVVGTDPSTDLAVLKIEASNLKTLPLGDSSKANVGDVVLAIGNPLNVGQTVTMGIISAKGRATGAGTDSYEDFIQTDAPINHGNSGGALVNVNGELIGINSQILTPSDGNIGIGFAIPSNMARSVMDQLRTNGKVSRSQLGVKVQGIDADLAASLKLPDTRGAIISNVDPGSAAARAGLKQGDVIVGVNGEKLADNNELRNKIASTKPGSTVSIDIIRDGNPQTVHATLDAKTATPARPERGDSESGSGFGLSVQPLTPEIARQLQLTKRTEGVVIRSVDDDSPAAEAGLQEGDVISQVNGQAVKTPEELKAALNKTSGRPALLLVTRDNVDIFRTIKK